MDNQRKARIRNSNRRIQFFLCLCGIALLTSCSSSPEQEEQRRSLALDYGVITGSIAYPGNYSYTDGSLVIDISLTQYDFVTGNTQEISHQRIRNPQRFPVNYTIRYDSKDILPYMRYSISVQVRRSGETVPYLEAAEDAWVLTAGNSDRANIQLTVSR